MKKKLLIILALTGLCALFVTIPQASRLINARKGVVERPAVTSSSVHGVPVEITPLGQEYLKVYSSFKVHNAEDIDSYISKRRPQLSDLAKMTPDRQIEVVISPSRKLSLEEFGKKSRKYGMIFEELSLDIFVDGKWDHTVWFDKRTSVVDISNDPSILTKQIIEVESSRNTPPLRAASSAASRSRHSRMDVTIRFTRGRMNAQAAVGLQADSDILLVDPTTDLADAFKGKAREIRVSGMPQLYVEKELRFGESYRIKNSRP